MVRNDERRRALSDAGIRVLAQEGARGLTHRAVDAAAATPMGTASNYFATRDELIGALVSRIEERLAPTGPVVDELAARAPDRELFLDYLRELVRRLGEDPHVPLALFELRLEAARRPAIAGALGAWRQRLFEGDVAFTASAGLPGQRADIALFHYALDGLLLDRLTVPLETGVAMDEALSLLVERLLPE